MAEMMERILFNAARMRYPCKNEDFLYYQQKHEDALEQLKQELPDELYHKIAWTYDNLYNIAFFSSYFYFCIGYGIGKMWPKNSTSFLKRTKSK